MSKINVANPVVELGFSTPIAAANDEVLGQPITAFVRGQDKTTQFKGRVYGGRLGKFASQQLVRRMVDGGSLPGPLALQLLQPHSESQPSKYNVVLTSNSLRLISLNGKPSLHREAGRWFATKHVNVATLDPARDTSIDTYHGHSFIARSIADPDETSFFTVGDALTFQHGAEL